MYEDHLMKLPGAEKQEMQELYFFLVQASLFAEQGSSLQELASCMKKGESTIRLYFKEIRSNGMLKKHQAGRQVGYSLDLRVVNGYLNMED
jgi:predicted transcriptional regulator